MKMFLNGRERKFGILICGSFEAVDNWIKRLHASGLCNYFVRFKDTRGPALQYGYAEWAEKANGGNGIYVNW